jgi:hypothetical protein
MSDGGMSIVSEFRGSSACELSKWFVGTSAIFVAVEHVEGAGFKRYGWETLK